VGFVGGVWGGGGWVGGGGGGGGGGVCSVLWKMFIIRGIDTQF